MFKSAIFTAVLLAVTLSEAMEFVVRDGDDAACILLDIEFTLDLVANDNGSQIDAVQFSQSTQGLQAVGNCDTPEITVLGESNAWEFDFSFSNEDPSSVKVAIKTSAVPGHIFTDSRLENVTEAVVFPAQSLDLGSPDNSWQCHSHLTFNYPDQSQGEFTFSAEYTIIYVRVQAYNVVNNTFSEADECSQDPTQAPDVTTVAPMTTTDKASSLASHFTLMCAMYLLFVSIMF